MSIPILSDADFIISDVKVTHSTPNFVTSSINGKVNAKSRGLHSLEVQAKVTLVNSDDIKKFQALMLRIRGRLNPFMLSLQDQTDGKGFCNPLFTPVSPMLANDISIGQTKMVLSGFSGVIPAGSVFTFANDTKTHVILNDTKSNQEAEFFPAVRSINANKTKLNFSPIPLVRLDGDSFEVSYDNAKEITLKMKEVM